jgi:hypothetical protein
MNRIRLILIFFLISAFGFSGIFLPSCKKNPPERMIVFTLVSGKLQDISLTAQEPAEIKFQERIAALNRNQSGSQPYLLTEGFYSARSPEISRDGSSVLFSAQQKQGDI